MVGLPPGHPWGYSQEYPPPGSAGVPPGLPFPGSAARELPGSTPGKNTSRNMLPGSILAGTINGALGVPPGTPPKEPARGYHRALGVGASGARYSYWGFFFVVMTRTPYSNENNWELIFPIPCGTCVMNYASFDTEFSMKQLVLW